MMDDVCNRRPIPRETAAGWRAESLLHVNRNDVTGARATSRESASERSDVKPQTFRPSLNNTQEFAGL